MEAKRYIGIDLHRNCFTACLRLENGREYLKEWKLEDMAKFTAKLRPHRRGGRGGDGQHAAVSRRGGAARGAGGGGESQPVQGDHAFGEEDGPE